MKKIVAIVLVSFLIAIIVSSCRFEGAGEHADRRCHTEPHAVFLNLVVADLAAQGINLKVVEFTDYVTPNKALEDGQIDANFFQHIPYLESFNKEQGYHLVNAGGIHIEPIALYSRKVQSLDALANGSTIAIPNDPTNGGRALLLLESAGLITLNAGAGITATPIQSFSSQCIAPEGSKDYVSQSRKPATNKNYLPAGGEHVAHIFN